MRRVTNRQHSYKSEDHMSLLWGLLGIPVLAVLVIGSVLLLTFRRPTGRM